MSRREIVNSIWSSDRKRCVEILRSGDLFTFEERGEEAELGGTFWTVLSGGGLHQSAEDAEATARADIPWLRDETAT